MNEDYQVLNPALIIRIDKILNEGIETHYKSFKIPKRSKGLRTIKAPSKELKLIQKEILKRLTALTYENKYAHGFVKKKNLVTNACAHRRIPFIRKGTYIADKFDFKAIPGGTKQAFYTIENCIIDESKGKYAFTSSIAPKSMARIDLKDAFGSITRTHLRATLVGLNSSKEIQESVENILRICNICTLDGSLPQGAPTSPILLNLCLSGLDVYAISVLAKIAKEKYKEKIVYTRYADDIVISSDGNNIKRLIPILNSIIEHFGLKVNKKKTRIMTSKTGLFITGINLVNSSTHISVSRKTRANIRSAIHNTSKMVPFTEERTKAKQRIMGRISHIMSIDLAHGSKLLQYGLDKKVLLKSDLINNVSGGAELISYLENLSPKRKQFFSKPKNYANDHQEIAFDY
jgi:RNA-directed DNA polymerase